MPNIVQQLRGANHSSVTINGIELTATIREQHKLSGALTERDIEEGSVTNDHFVKNAREIIIEGVVSDNPLPGFPGQNIVSAVTAFVEGDEAPSMTAWLEFERTFEIGDVIEISSHRGFLDNMVITQFETSITVGTARELRFTMHAKKANIVQTAYTQAITVPSVKTAEKVKKKGKKPPKKPNDQQKSWAASKYDSTKDYVASIFK